ncbi:MAG TPA: type II CAAX endopeptidase family protein [Balneolaceae bacterium]|nr:type II CAAX endopeptidase family protein [Balneolaceae bacterium]
MSNLFPWMRIILAVGIYIIFALLALFISAKMKISIQKMESRTSGPILAIGAIANLCVLGATLLLLKFLDGRPLSTLGILLKNEDLYYTIAGIAIIFSTAVILLLLLRKLNNTVLNLREPAKNWSEWVNLLAGIGVLFIVALQEEVLYRGYVTLNLIHYNPLIIVGVTTILFTVIHLITNKGGFYQVMSWLMGGVLFSIIYLITGSIWIPVLLHFAIDLNNLVTFNITGRFSFFEPSPPLTKKQVVVYKAISSLILIIIVLSWYGPSVKLH